MHELLSRTIRSALGVIVCGVGGIGAIALIVLAIQYTGGWAFLLAPVSVILAILLIRLGTKLIAST